MDVFDAVRTVLAVRSFQEEPVSDDVLRKIVEAGRLTASSINLQPWHFIVVRERESLRRLGELVKTGPYIAQASLAIVVAIEKDSMFSVSDGSRAIQDMILTAWSEGIGSNWAGFGDNPDVSALLGIPPELGVLAVVPFGYPVQAVGQGKKKRKPLSGVVSLERYGQPFA
ncbi:MAG TPA: nitroreductase family protein [Chloroflexota bacterium]